MANQLDSQTYEQIGLDELIAYAVARIVEEGRALTHEEIVAMAFTLFPKRFSLRGYPQWPDSAVVSKSWWRCRSDKHYMDGSVKQGFHLTPKGLSVAKNVEQRLANNSYKEIKTELRTKAGRLLHSLEKSKAYEHFKRTGSVDGLQRHELTDMLLCMPDSEMKVIKHNYEQFKQAAVLYARNDISELLGLVIERLIPQQSGVKG
jgi:hypothetical protein